MSEALQEFNRIAIVFNIPTLGDACKYAADDGLQAMAKSRLG